MSIKYDSKRELLSEIIKKATSDATYVIPDLQRPYVWPPSHVTLLIDSLFKGWPFGSLLIWEVKPDCFGQNEGIPHRPFWEIVDRTPEDGGSVGSTLGMPATYHMVLDGQQRIQSLVLALGGDQWGFKMNDADWAMDLQGRRVKPSSHWSKATLCVDLNKFEEELASKGKKVRRIEVGKILEWVVSDKEKGQSGDFRPSNYVYPLPKTWEHQGRYIRLARFWNIAEKDLSESEYEELLTKLLDEHQVVDKGLLRPLAEFMKLVENVKINSFVHALQIESFKLTPQWSKDDYSDAIVNIFTRLNTAGRTLSREEITLAWLKVGWVPEKTGGKTAGKCLEELKSEFWDYDLQLGTDEIVRLISFVWSVETRNGGLLDSKDLLKGEIIRSLATHTALQWTKLFSDLKNGIDLIHARDLLKSFESFNSIIVLLCWCRLVFRKLEEFNGLKVVVKDDLEKQCKQRAEHFIDRWVFASHWAGVWGDSATTSFPNFSSDLNQLHTELSNCTADNFLTILDKGIERLMARVVSKANQHIDNLIVQDRKRVQAYYQPLWVWHRLNESRWKHSSLPMRTGRKRVGKLEVDHAVSDAWWSRLVEKLIQIKLSTFTGTEMEKWSLGPDEFKSRFEALAFVNLLGNCSLLDKSFNISKNDKSMWSFLQEVHEFKNGTFKRDEWEQALALNKQITEPDGISLAELKDAIQTRDLKIRSELKAFIEGTLTRVDV